MLNLLKSPFLIGTLLVGLVCGVYVRHQDWLAPIQNWTFDTYQSLYPRIPEPEKMPARVVIVDVDEKSLDQYGQWPWSRAVLAQLVQRLREYGVLVTGFDMVFSESDRTSPKEIARNVGQLAPNMAKLIASLPDHDDLFAQAITGGRVVLGQVGEHKQIPEGRLHPKAQFGVKQTALDAPVLSSLLHRYSGAVINLANLEAHAAGIGLFSTLPDKDGVYRKVALLERIGENDKHAVIFPALSLEMIRVALGGADNAFITVDENGIRNIILKAAGGGKFEIPTDANGRIWVHFAKYATGKPPLYISAKDVLMKKANPKLLAGALAIVGTSAIGLKDIRATPISGQLPGVEVHAQVMETILSNAHLQREVSHFQKIPLTDFYFTLSQMELLLIFLGGMTMVLIVPRLPSLLVFAAGMGMIASLVALGWYHYLHDHILVDYAYPSLGIFSVFFVLTYLNYMREETQRKQIRAAFGHYVSPALLEQLASNPEKLVLGGETRRLTILFSDIRGFTTISERFNAQELTRFINRFLTPMTDVILANHGTVDKYMGDAIMAFWNAPLDDLNHAQNACYAALAMQKAVKALNAALEQEMAMHKAEEGENRRYFMPVAIGVGVNTGDCCVGNVGSEQRFDYSALGDDVNLASRLEGQSKIYGVDIVLGEHTVAQIGEDFAVLELDFVQVKGKTVPVRIFALLGDEVMRHDPIFKTISATMALLLTAYRYRKWDDAEAYAIELSHLYSPLTELSRLYISRIHLYRETPPPQDWNGAYVATSK